MTSELMVSSLISGLANGVIYVLIAIGFTIMFSVAKIINFAHGEIFMGGALILWSLNIVLGVGYLGAAISSILILGLLGLLAYTALFRFVRGDVERTVIVSIGVLLIIQNVGATIIPQARGIPSIVQGVVHLGSTTLSVEKLLTIGVATIVILALYFFTEKTGAGRSMRAYGQDKEAANIVGVNSENVIQLTYIVSFALAGIAAVLMAPLTSVNPAMGGPALMTTLIVVILGGIGSVTGAVMGGILLGVLEGFGQTFLGAMTAPATFGIIILILVFRPKGLLGREELRI